MIRSVLRCLCRHKPAGVLPVLLVATQLAPSPAGHCAPGPAPVYFRSNLGVSTGAGTLPERLDPAQNTVWRTPMDPGHSTPILVDGRLFLTTFRPESKELATVAVDESTGRILWRRTVPAERIEATHQIGSPATSTPASDGRRVFVFFGSHGLVAYDLEGTQLWEHRFGPFRDEFGAGSSPILVDGRVIVQQDHDVDSFIAALDAATGKLLWKTSRPQAVRSYSTPAVWEQGGRKQLLAAGALELASYDPATGEKLWWVNGLARIVIPIPIPSGDRVYMAAWAPGGDAGRRITLDPWSAALAKWDKNGDGQLARAEVNDKEVLDRFFRMDLDQSGSLDAKEWDHYAEIFRRAQNAVLAIKPSGRGALPDEAILWKYNRGVPYVATPLADQGLLWMVKDGGIVTKIDAATGRVLQEERVPGIGNYYASPVSGDGKVYFAGEQGVVSVVANQPDWKVISSHPFGEKIYATPVIGRGRIYLRTEKALYSFGSALK